MVNMVVEDISGKVVSSAQAAAAEGILAAVVEGMDILSAAAATAATDFHMGCIFVDHLRSHQGFLIPKL